MLNLGALIELVFGLARQAKFHSHTIMVSQRGEGRAGWQPGPAPIPETGMLCRIGDADVRSLTTLRVGGRRDWSQVQALAFTRSANIVHVPARKASSGRSGSLLSRTAMAGPVVPTSTPAPPLSPPPGDDGVHRRAEDRPRPGGLRRDQERRPDRAGRTAAGIDVTACCGRRADRTASSAANSPGLHRQRGRPRADPPRPRRVGHPARALSPRAIAFAVAQPYDVAIGDITIRPAVQG